MTTRLARGLGAAVLVSGALLPVSIPVAGDAFGVPCYEAQCVPNVARDVVEGGACAPQPRRAFAYGLEPDGGTVVCSAAGVWVAAGPLVGVYNVSTGCPTLNLSAQGSDGIALQCLETGLDTLRWSHRASPMA
jgi:hypothetical protein